MAYDIVTAEREFALLLEAPAKPPIGRPAISCKGSDLAPVINKHPETEPERFSRILSLKKAGYLVPVNESVEFMDMADYSDDGGFQSEQDAFDAFDAFNWGV